MSAFPVLVLVSAGLAALASADVAYLGSGIDAPSEQAFSIGATNATDITIGRSGQTVTVAGNFTVLGETTTINTTSLDVSDAVIAVNNTTGPDAPVPTYPVGLLAHRGDVGGTPRDHAAAAWVEGSYWRFSYLADDEVTWGADLAIRCGGAELHGDLIHDTGAFSLDGQSASSIITSSGALTFTSAAAATWSTTAGVLSLDGAGGLSLKGGGNAALVINSAGTSITVQAGATLGATGSGNINLPNNGSARFQIAGSNVSANVTAANLGTLTAGSSSNADALHTHALSARNKLVIDGLTTSGLTAGNAAYYSGANTLGKTDSQASNTARFAGIYEGTSGEMVSAGKTTALFTTAGGSPSNGAPVYLAAATDDGGAGAGKLTATPPASGSGLVRAKVAIVIDNSLYASAKTCVVQVQSEAPILLQS